MNPDVRSQIETAIANHDVLLFMKGTRDAPSCGFSARTIEVLNALLPKYSTVDVLAHPEIREGIKEFSSWPTIPQLYVKGQFVGGADIVAQMFESGELHESLGVAAPGSSPPAIEITERAADAFRGFLQDTDEVVLLEIDARYQPSLSIGPRPASCIVAEHRGVEVALDRLSATRAEGITIDFVETPEGQAFRVDNPNEPKAVRQMPVSELKKRFEQGAPLHLIDVRTKGEWETARIEGSRLLDEDAIDELLSLPKDTTLVFQCHHGHRSQRVAEQFVAQGFLDIHNLEGGIDAWSQEIDPNVPRY